MKVAIAGYALEGRVNYQYWAQQGHDVTIVDERELPVGELPYGVPTLMGEGVFGKLQDFDLVVRTASLNPSKITTNGKIWSATNEFFDKCPADIIGVTGTKGKGTTCSLIASMLKAAGKTVHLVGNIGTSALEVLPNIKPDDIVVFELSSFQLWDIEKSPHVAVVLLIEPEHLDVHHDIGDYVGAKSNIRVYQTDDDICVYHPSNRLSTDVAHASKQGQLIRYGQEEDGGVYVRGGNFSRNGQDICSTSALQLLGRHNLENACAAITVAKIYELDDRSIEKGLRDFKGLPHRLEFVRTVDGVDYYNDSFSSAPAATLAAVSSFEQPEVLIVGGVDRGADFTELATQLANKKNIKKLIVVGEIRHKLKALFDSAGLGDKVELLEVKTMKEILAKAKNAAVASDVVLLSPACASFDMFKDFYDRGDQFRELVKGL